MLAANGCAEHGHCTLLGLVLRRVGSSCSNVSKNNVPAFLRICIS